MKKFMVVEHFKPECIGAVYERLNEKGRMLPEGLNYLNSWVNREMNVCYQLMETNNPDLFLLWTSLWDDLTDFEIVSVD